MTLKHAGKLPKTAMGHNWALAHGTDEPGVVADGMEGGAAEQHENPGDTRIIAHTKLIGGESDTATFKVPNGRPAKATRTSARSRATLH